MYLGSYSMILSFGTNGPKESSPNLLITWQNNERGMKSDLCWMFDHVHFNPPVGFCAPLPQRRAFLFGCRSLHSPASPSEESDRLSETPPLEGSNPGQVERTQIRFTSDSISNDSDSGLKTNSPWHLYRSPHRPCAWVSPQSPGCWWTPEQGWPLPSTIPFPEPLSDSQATGGT